MDLKYKATPIYFQGGLWQDKGRLLSINYLILINQKKKEYDEIKPM